MSPDLPPNGSRWQHPRLRGTWVVAIVGRKWITLAPSLPQLGPRTVEISQWPKDLGEEWTRA